MNTSFPDGAQVRQRLECFHLGKLNLRDEEEQQVNFSPYCASIYVDIASLVPGELASQDVRILV